MFQALQTELYLLPIMDHLGNIYSASAAVSLDGQQTNNGVAEPDGIIHRPLSVTLSKEEPGTDPSVLENALKELLDKNQEEGDFNWNEVGIVHFNSQVWANSGQIQPYKYKQYNRKAPIQFGDF